MKSANKRKEFEPLDLDAPTLDRHFSAISGVFQRITGKRELTFRGETDTSRVMANLAGGDCGYAHAARRGRTPVVALVELKDDVWAWMGVSGQWEVLEARSKRAKRKFRFASLALSVYFGPQDDENKLLMFRAEWSGSKPAGDGTFTFAPATAGHPHWHFDALTSVGAETREIIDGRRSIVEVQNAELFETYEIDPIKDLLKPGIDRIHFASGTAWWKSETAHLHTPANRGELEAWAHGCAKYIKNELGSLFARGRRRAEANV